MRRAFTLVELLVVISIISMLAGMTIPAILRVREAGRQTQCSQNLSQLGLALQQYETAHETLPAGVRSARGPIRNAPTNVPLGWMPEVLPYLGMHLLHSRIDFGVTADDPKNAEARAVQVPTFVCPSCCDALNSRVKNRDIALGTYAACHHDVEAPIDADNHGMFFRNSKLRTQEIPDGAAYTILLGEKRARLDDLGWLSGTRATMRNTGLPINTEEKEPPDPNFDAAAASADGDDPPANPVPKPKPAAQPAGPDPELYVGGFLSQHSQGANFLLGDGAIRFLTRNIDDTLYQYLGHRADGHLIRSLEQLNR